MLPSPWVMLAVVIMWGGSLVYANHYGSENQKNADVAAQKQAVDKAVTDAKADAEVDYSAQQELALEAQKRELAKQQSSRKVEQAMAADPAASDCRMSDLSFSVLRTSLDASDTATGTPASAGDGAVPGVDQTGRPVAGGGGVRAGQHGVDPLDVQIGSQRTH